MRAGKHELSSLPPAALGQAPGAGENDPAPQHVPQPTTSLLSTAMRPASPPLQPASPPAQHAGSVVSQTALARSAAKPALARAGTPASVYGQGQEAGRERAASPQGSHATEQARCALPLCWAWERGILALSPFGGALPTSAQTCPACCERCPAGAPALAVAPAAGSIPSKQTWAGLSTFSSTGAQMLKYVTSAHPCGSVLGSRV